ncbi:hypothetical protein B0H16DRAFT_1741594 [Mycena metata]|uniref:Uncharacterized protein n=1 Tax=Mycena metata TaxID=1033252 RepID=A0AAD7HAH2_9AGAR|nr:hypothetical protein B0H16DRAFT_1741594 [Mycena metata]
MSVDPTSSVSDPRGSSPITISSDDNEPVVTRVVTFVPDSSDDEITVLPRTPACRKLLPSAPPAKKKKSKKQRAADAIKNTARIDTYFLGPMGTSRRVPLHRRRQGPTRTLPLVGSSTAVAPYSPRVHRPPIAFALPARIVAPDSPAAHTAGWRQLRAHALGVIDLWRNGTMDGPPDVAPLQKHHACPICIQLKSHPVTFVAIQ